MTTMSTPIPVPDTAEERAYRRWYGHTVLCGTCRAGGPCSVSAALGRAWRRARS